MGNRKPHSDNAGYVSERKCAAGGHVVIYDREKGLDLDGDYRWVVMHEPSSVHVCVSSKTRAYEVMYDAAIDPFETLGLARDWQQTPPVAAATAQAESAGTVDLSVDRDQLARDTADVLPMPAEYPRAYAPAAHADGAIIAGDTIAEVRGDETVTFAEYQDLRKQIYELTHERDYLQREYDAISQAFDGYMKANAEREDREESLQRELAAAQAEAAALREERREVEDLLMQNGHHTPTVRLADQVNGVYRSLSAEADRAADVIDDLQQYRGWINDLIEGIDHVSPIEALTRLLAFRRTYETDRARFADDAALVAALRQRADSDPATWLTTAQVESMVTFAEDDDE